jgi:hypothetical protein
VVPGGSLLDEILNCMYEDLLKMGFFDKSFDLGLALNIGIFCMFGSFKDPTQCATGKKDHEQREKSIDID